MFDPETMRKRFRDLAAQKEAMRAAADPLRAERDAATAACDAIVKPLEQKLRQIEAPLFAIDQERAVIARALSGKTGAA